MLASKWGSKGWKKNAFVALGTSALTILGGLLGKYAGKAIASLGNLINLIKLMSKW